MRLRTMLAALLGSVALILSFGANAQAAPTSQIQFRLIYYNSPGPDTGSNASLNAEYVTLKNIGTTARYLTGWTVEDAQSHVYTFGTFRLAAGQKVRIHTGRGTNTSTDLYWGRGWYVWNNTGDKAKLHNAAGAWKDSCSWGSGGPGYLYC
jgi:Lamin Tail Domain